MTQTDFLTICGFLVGFGIGCRIVAHYLNKELIRRQKVVIKKETRNGKTIRPKH